MKQDVRLVTTIAPGYDLYFGCQDNLLQQLIELSKLPEMVATVPRDASERFTSIEAFYQRPVDAQQLYWLLHGDEVAGVMWFRRKQPPFPIADTDYTIAIRIYPAHQGKGLSRPLLTAAHADFLAHHADVRGFWLQTRADNLKAQHTYEKFGYRVLAQDSADVTMALAAQHLS
ncbi:MAG TPA: GNAT family N-acetyltransferase [Candidatus Saccharimonadales bacterium]|jgi:ribosomal protein S18 acetylase RimI-like enzyme|nr:GNAT family N-acetyltransferase [Candidatus Saccharimonadales bacterium]